MIEVEGERARGAAGQGASGDNGRESLHLPVMSPLSPLWRQQVILVSVRSPVEEIALAALHSFPIAVGEAEKVGPHSGADN